MLKCIIFGVVGAAAGFASATLLWKKKFEKEAQEEVESMREYVEMVKAGENVVKVDFGDREKDVEELKAVIKPYAGSEVSKIDKFKPYEIPEEDFVIEDEDFSKTTLEYYVESGLLYEGNEVVSADDVVGRDILNKLHGFGDDVMYVRNEKYNTDYEVIKVEGVGPER